MFKSFDDFSGKYNSHSTNESRIQREDVDVDVKSWIERIEKFPSFKGIFTDIINMKPERIYEVEDVNGFLNFTYADPNILLQVGSPNGYTLVKWQSKNEQHFCYVVSKKRNEFFGIDEGDNLYKFLEREYDKVGFIFYYLMDKRGRGICERLSYFQA